MKYLYPCMPNRCSIDSRLFNILDKDSQYVAEIKKNGWRCLIMKENGNMRLWTRRNTIIPDYLPELRAELDSIIPDNSIIDGELIHKRTKDIKENYYAFDVIRLKGKDLWRKPLELRRLFLETVFYGDMVHIEIPEQFRIGRKALYHMSIENENEGIVFKNIKSLYPVSQTSCQTNPMWIKVKRDEEAYKEAK